MSDSIRLLLADDHTMLREALRRAMEAAELTVVGEAADGDEAVRLTHELHPDVVLMDVSMPVLDGLQAVAKLRSKKCRTKFVFLTVHEDLDFVGAAFSAGASGYVVKSHITTDLVPAIREVIEGRTFVSSTAK